MRAGAFAIRTCGWIAWGLILAACAGREVPVGSPEPVLYSWHGDHLAGPLEMTIALSQQRAYFTVGGVDAGWATVATGKEGHETPLGHFTVTEKIVDKYSSHYGRIVDAYGAVIDIDADSRVDRPPPGGHFEHAPMPYWMRLTRYGIGMHAGPIPNPGDPASKGCIRLPKAFAPTLFSRVRVGTPVRIVH